MKKALGFAALVLFLANWMPGASLTLIQPNGGETFPLGRPNIQIKWNATGVTQNVRINLLKGGAVVGTIAASLPATSSPFLWTAGKLADGTTVQSGFDYKVRIRAIDSSEADESDGVFSLVVHTPPPPPPAPALLKLKWPNGGEKMILHRDFMISWESNAPDAIGKVQLDLMMYKKETEQWMIGVIADNLPATGSYSWKAGEYPGHTADSGQYKIRVRSMTSNRYSDSSDAPFNLSSMTDSFKKAVASGAAITTLAKPDLVVCGNAIVYTPTNTPGTFHVHVRNIGGSTAKAPFAVMVTLTMNETRRVMVQTDLAPGETRWVCDYSASSPGNVGWSFVARVDPDDVIKEADEQNNRLHGSLQIGRENTVAIPYSCSDGSPM